MKKNERFFSALNGIGDKYILEADPTKKKGFNIKKFAILAACFCLVFTSLNLWLFLPIRNIPENISQYRNSEYYPIIEKLNEYNTGVPKFKNNFSMILNAISNLSINGVKGEGLGYIDRFPTYNDIIEGDKPVTDVTDNQVSGVIETDIIKRSDEYIFYLYAGELYIYNIAGEDTKCISSFSFNKFLNKDEVTYYSLNGAEFFLSSDKSTAIFIFDGFTKTKERDYGFVKVLALDVSDPKNEESLVIKNEFTITGSFSDARFVDGKLLLVSEFYAPKDVDFSKEENFLPQYKCGDNEFQTVGLGDIIVPDKLTSSRYQVISLLDINTLDFDDCTALLSYSSTLYVSKEAIYITRSFNNKQKEDKIVKTTSQTEICGISYADGELKELGRITINGNVKDQYSLDEYEGILRVATTTNVNFYKETIFYRDDYSVVDVVNTNSGRNANLYCIDLSDWSIRAKVEDFAPWGEEVKSVRFDKDSAYICTAIMVTDPVFFFDLSDLDNITYKDTGNILGFSSSLIQFKDGFLVGIGVDGSGEFKLEIYEETKNGVESVDAYTANASYSLEYKSYFIDRENGLIGLGLYCYDKYDGASAQRYVLLHFDGYKIREVINVGLQAPNVYMRGCLIDGYFYIFGGENFNVIKLGY